MLPNSNIEKTDDILRTEHITKLFSGTRALDDITMSVKKGTVHVIVGENGAGKSTLMKIINGIYKPDSGTIYFDGRVFEAKDPTQARDLGISMIYQELNIVPEMTIAENIYLGREPMQKNKMLIDDKMLYAMAGEYLEQQKLSFNLKDKMKTLSVSQAQMIEIIKAISCNAKLIIMDEPTSAITDTEVNYLFEKINLLRASGVTIIYISHKMDEIFRIADYVSIFRDGQHIETKPISAYTIDTIISKMVGREMKDVYPQREANIEKEIFRVEDFKRGDVFKNVSFGLHKGEILGVSGLMGAGRTEIMRAIFGLDKIERGKVFIDGKEVKIKNVSDAIENGIAMVSENRRLYGLVPVRNIKENISLVGLKHYFKSWLIKHKKEDETAADMVKRLAIKTQSLETQVKALSGGNQQKVVLAKWLISTPKIIIMDEPTRGIDVGAKYEIYKLMCELTQQGMSIIMISSELPELLGMSDRILVVCQGEIVKEFYRKDATQIEIMKYATGGISNGQA